MVYANSDATVELGRHRPSSGRQALGADRVGRVPIERCPIGETGPQGLAGSRRPSGPHQAPLAHPGAACMRPQAIAQPTRPLGVTVT